jgi:hypothetical protein
LREEEWSRGERVRIEEAGRERVRREEEREREEGLKKAEEEKVRVEKERVRVEKERERVEKERERKRDEKLRREEEDRERVRREADEMEAEAARLLEEEEFREMEIARLQEEESEAEREQLERDRIEEEARKASAAKKKQASGGKKKGQLKANIPKEEPIKVDEPAASKKFGGGMRGLRDLSRGKPAGGADETEIEKRRKLLPKPQGQRLIKRDAVDDLITEFIFSEMPMNEDQIQATLEQTQFDDSTISLLFQEFLSSKIFFPFSFHETLQISPLSSTYSTPADLHEISHSLREFI